MFRQTCKKILNRNNKGTTLVEMLVCFMMLAIFLTAAFSVITHLSTLYYQIKGETYGKQVSDILMLKIQSEIEGAKTRNDDVLIDGNKTNTSGSTMVFYDRTDTKVELSTVDGYFQIKYFAFENETDSNKSRNENTWKYDKNVYNGFYIDSITYIKASDLSSGSNKSLAESYGVTVGDNEYGDDVILVLLNLKSHHYGEYKSYRFIRMYNYQDSPSSGESNP